MPREPGKLPGVKEVIPVKKHTYRSIEIQKVTAAQILAWIVTPVVILALDVAKKRVLVAIANAAGEAARLVHFAMPAELPTLLELGRELARAGRTVQLVQEPTGTYGDPIAAGAHTAGLEVFLVSPKRTHDAAELFDGVPSKHDPKDATILARLHAQGLSRRWQPMPEERREMRALVAERELYAGPLDAHLGRVEARLAGWWPELLQQVDVRARISLQRWLARYPDPALVRAQPKEAAEALRRESRGNFAAATIDAIVQSAQRTQGGAMTAGERQMLKMTFEEIVRLRERCDEVEGRIEKALGAKPAQVPLLKMLAPTTLAVLLAMVGDPTQYASARTFEKACGLNLKECSSGVRQDYGLHLTKRGPGLVRKYLYLLAMRLVGGHEVVRAWYQRRASFRADHKLPALIAVMRNLVKAVWHVAKGQAFDVTKLFDLRRLGVVPTTAADATDPASVGGAATA